MSELWDVLSSELSFLAHILVTRFFHSFTFGNLKKTRKNKDFIDQKSIFSVPETSVSQNCDCTSFGVRHLQFALK